MGVSILNIYVGNIAWGMTEDDLEALFAEFGSVTSANIITDKYSGRSRGFGFVVMVKYTLMEFHRLLQALMRQIMKIMKVILLK